LGLRERLAPPGFAAPPFRDAHFGPPRRPIPPAGGPEAGQLHSHGPWDGRGALGWGSECVWRHPVSPPHPAGTPTSALRVGPYRRPEVRRRASCTHTAHGTVGGPLVGFPAPALLHLLHRRRRGERPSPLSPPALWRAARAHLWLEAPRARCRGMPVRRLPACKRAGAVVAAVAAPAPCPKYCIHSTIFFTQNNNQQ
jgi:hypothetical protein